MSFCAVVLRQHIIGGLLILSISINQDMIILRTQGNEHCLLNAVTEKA